MKKICPISGREFEWRDEDLQFYEKMGVPVPEIHPDEMLRNMMALRNEWNLYRRKCDATGEMMISAYHEGTPFPVYTNEYWWGDSWDPMEYGAELDLDQPFFEQFLALRDCVPREGTSVTKSENCAYNSHIRESKNCYLSSLVYRGEDCYYSAWLVNVRDLVDCRMMTDCELCYVSMNCVKCFECVMVQEGTGCNECYFSYQMRGCDHCIGCSNLANKSYHVFNKRVTPAEYEKVKSQIFNGSYVTWQHGLDFFKKMWGDADHRCVHNLNTENGVGDLLMNSRNCYQTFEGWEAEDCAYNISCDHSNNLRHTYSAGWPGCELIHVAAVSRASTDLRFCYYSWSCNNLTYCDSNNACSDCFGCVGLKHKKYCILNRQYSEDKYKKLVPQLIQKMTERGEWGQIPREFSTFAYNETAAQDYLSLTQEQAEKMGFRWDRSEDRKTESGVKISDSIHDVDDSILDQVLECEATGKNFKIQKGELEFYRKMNLPLPRLCPEQRRKNREARRNPYQLWERECAECSSKMQTTFSPDRPERVVCEECYQRSVD